jgi:SAM-dependent methyltransferase
MADALIYSVSEFSDLILESLKLADARNIVEIGAEYGGMSALLAEYCRARDGRFTTVDPAPRAEFLAWVKDNPEVRHLAKASLEAFDDIEEADAWVVDGDHNWYTVYHELRQIEMISRRAGKPVLVFLHDIGWPCGRRDFYYAPERIPAEYRHPHIYGAGVVLDHAKLVTGRGFRGMGASFALATVHGGPRNGVMTAIDDFLAESLKEGREFGFAEVPRRVRSRRVVRYGRRMEFAARRSLAALSPEQAAAFDGNQPPPKLSSRPRHARRSSCACCWYRTSLTVRLSR